MDVSELSGHLQQVANNLTQQSFDETLGGPVREVVLRGIRANFNASQSPDGRRWPPRKNTGDGHPLLMDTGALMQAATGGGVGHVTEVSDNVLLVGVDTSVDKGGIPAAKIHNKGIGRMPQREFMGVSDERLDQEVDDVIADAGLGAFDGE